MWRSVQSVAAGQRRLRCELVAADERGPRAGILLLHEAYGLLDYVREDGRKLAEAGYLVMMPDLFSAGGALRYCMKQFFTADGLLNRGSSEANAEVHDLLDALAGQPGCNGRLGMIGQCLSGGFVLQMARRSDLAAPVVFHHSLGLLGAGAPPSELREIAGPVLGHFAVGDRMCPRARSEALKAELGERLHETYYSGAGHGLRSVYRGSPQGEEAWARTLAFFAERLG